MAEEVKLCESLLAGSSGLAEEDRTLLQDNLDCLQGRLSALGGALGQRCEHMRSRAQELALYQVGFKLRSGSVALKLKSVASRRRTCSFFKRL